MNERAYLEAAADGDREAFCELVRLHQARLRALAALSLHDRDDVLDVVQESFVDAWRNLHGYDHTRPFGPWLRTICRNRILKCLRDRVQHRRRELALVDQALATFSPLDELSDDILDKRLENLHRCLDLLDDRHRLLLQQRYGDDLTVNQLAQQLGKSPNAVSMILLRLKSTLQRCLAGALPS